MNYVISSKQRFNTAEEVFSAASDPIGMRGNLCVEQITQSPRRTRIVVECNAKGAWYGSLGGYYNAAQLLAHDMGAKIREAKESDLRGA